MGNVLWPTFERYPLRLTIHAIYVYLYLLDIIVVCIIVFPRCSVKKTKYEWNILPNTVIIMTVICLVNNCISFISTKIFVYCLVLQLIRMWGSVIHYRSLSTGSSVNLSILYSGTTWSIGINSTQMAMDLLRFMYIFATFLHQR